MAASNKSSWPVVLTGLLAWGAQALVAAQDTASAPATPAASSAAAPAPARSAGLSISDLAQAEKRARESEIQGRVNSMVPAPANPALRKAASSVPSTPKSRPVLWSLTGANHRYLAEVVYDKQLLVIQSGQDQVPGLGRLEWMDETGVYIRPPNRHKLNKSWFNSMGLLVLAAPRDGQDQPVLVDLPSPFASGMGMVTSSVGSAPVPLVLPQGVPSLSLAGPPTYVPSANPAPAAAAAVTSAPAATNTPQIPPQALERARAMGMNLPGAEKTESKGK